MTKIGRGPLGDATYQILRLESLWYQTKRFFHVFPYVKHVTPRAEPFLVQRAVVVSEHFCSTSFTLGVVPVVQDGGLHKAIAQHFIMSKMADHITSGSCYYTTSRNDKTVIHETFTQDPERIKQLLRGFTIVG